MDHKKKV